MSSFTVILQHHFKQAPPFMMYWNFHQILKRPPMPHLWQKPFHLSTYNDMECLGEITNTRQHKHQVNVVCPAGKNEYVWPEKWDEYYYFVKNIVCKIEPHTLLALSIHNITKKPRLCINFCWIINKKLVKKVNGCHTRNNGMVV